MDNRLETRARYYCTMLKLPKWDQRDMLDYLDKYFTDKETVEFMSAQTKIIKLELIDAANLIIKLLMEEDRKLARYAALYPATPTPILLAKVEAEMNEEMEGIVAELKAYERTDNQNKGCTFLFVVIMIALIVGIIAIVCD